MKPQGGNPEQGTGPRNKTEMPRNGRTKEGKAMNATARTGKTRVPSRSPLGIGPTKKKKFNDFPVRRRNRKTSAERRDRGSVAGR